MHMRTYLSLLEEKFGEKIVATMMEDGKARLRMGSSNRLYVKGLAEHNKKKVQELISPEYAEMINEGDWHWAFDFPGWIGELDFTAHSVKEIMVIGLEPHIGISKQGISQNRNFQSTYGLRETGENEFAELDEYKPNTRLWKNLYALFDGAEGYQSREFLNRFYITDMAHFAVQGKAKTVLNVKDWKRIRARNASKYLLREIELIRPRYIVSQSTVVADFVEDLLENIGERVAKKSTGDFSTKLPEKYTQCPTFKKFSLSGRTLIHLRLPHLASGMTNDFWLPAQEYNRSIRLNGIKEELLQFMNS